MAILQTVLRVIFIPIEVYLLFNCLYLLFFAFAGHFNKKKKELKPLVKRKFCILIPSYKHDEVITDTSMAALAHQYDGDFDIYVIADQLRDDTVENLRAHKINVIEVKFDKSTKGKALLTAIGQIPDGKYDIGLILDSDNIMSENFLEKINVAFEAGAIALQAHRVAKNFDNTFALLDACNEEINNHLFRKAHNNAGLGSALIGSGMAFEFEYLRHLLHGIDLVLAEDKEMDVRIGKDNIKVVYLDNAYVYDEKIADAEVFTNQRSRWIFSQLEALKHNFKESIVRLIRDRNVEMFDKIVQLMLLPRTLLLGALFAIFLQSFFNPFGFSPVFNAALLISAGVALLISLPRKFYNAQLLSVFVKMPAVIFLMVLALFRAGRTKRGWIHTPHNTVAKAD
jgi:cellulose synthase/poly-beta-1,6-N-acetylglucosamine synthase-like glycosyltransferase